MPRLMLITLRLYAPLLMLTLTLSPLPIFCRCFFDAFAPCHFFDASPLRRHCHAAAFFAALMFSRLIRCRYFSIFRLSLDADAIIYYAADDY